MFPTRQMTLADLLPGAPAVGVSSLAYDSRVVAPGSLFFCVPGFEVDGHDFAPDAVARGAAALVVERSLDLGVPEVVVASVREAMAPAAARFFGDPSAGLDLVGITGTNGKTTTAYLLRQMAVAEGRSCGMIGTVKTVIAGSDRTGVRTTPEAIEIQRDLRAMVDGGDRACAMEVSSVGLALHRADSLHFAAAVFTNLSPDHLDFHETMDAYFDAKRRLFEHVPAERAILNLDDQHGRRLAAELPGATTYAIDRDAEVRARDVRLDERGASVRVETPDGPLALRSPLIGRFNVSNVLAATAAARALGVQGEAIIAAAAASGQVPGRLQAIEEGQPFAVVVDYAHSPDAVEHALRVLRQRTGGRLICVFGATGSRFAPTRTEMGARARALADHLIVSSDNPGLEDPRAIRDILEGAGGDAEAIDDRRGAITHAVGLAQPADTVAILAGELPVQDAELARTALRELADP
ncbi:MAG: UDP-N-acetylmuramoyl-L-alanyl-D-glutamate--2,6-diaminopimelate ligase [Actinomycetota bacterium]|nr:UDP-N-acetylmuramoyl-L-alanyl-D-glutamate--2,6-diaminopimelate ligase [Actinomycetota bacterium]